MEALWCGGLLCATSGFWCCSQNASLRGSRPGLAAMVCIAWCAAGGSQASAREGVRPCKVDIGNHEIGGRWPDPTDIGIGGIGCTVHHSVMVTGQQEKVTAGLPHTVKVVLVADAGVQHHVKLTSATSVKACLSSAAAASKVEPILLFRPSTQDLRAYWTLHCIGWRPLRTA